MGKVVIVTSAVTDMDEVRLIANQVFPFMSAIMGSCGFIYPENKGTNVEYFTDYPITPIIQSTADFIVVTIFGGTDIVSIMANIRKIEALIADLRTCGTKSHILFLTNVKSEKFKYLGDVYISRQDPRDIELITNRVRAHLHTSDEYLQELLNHLSPETLNSVNEGLYPLGTHPIIIYSTSKHLIGMEPWDIPDGYISFEDIYALHAGDVLVADRLLYQFLMNNVEHATALYEQHSKPKIRLNSNAILTHLLTKYSMVYTDFVFAAIETVISNRKFDCFHVEELLYVREHMNPKQSIKIRDVIYTYEQFTLVLNYSNYFQGECGKHTREYLNDSVNRIC